MPVARVFCLPRHAIGIRPDRHSGKWPDVVGPDPFQGRSCRNRRRSSLPRYHLRSSAPRNRSGMTVVQVAGAPSRRRAIGPAKRLPPLSRWKCATGSRRWRAIAALRKPNAKNPRRGAGSIWCVLTLVNRQTAISEPPTVAVSSAASSSGVRMHPLSMRRVAGPSRQSFDIATLLARNSRPKRRNATVSDRLTVDGGGAAR